jgi:hypothetical protein
MDRDEVFEVISEEECLRLGDELCELAGHLAAAEAEWLAKLAAFDRRRVWATDGCRSGAHWLGWKLGFGHSTACEKVRVARALEGLPVMRAAFSRGELSYCKVRALTRVATPATEAELTETARYATGAHLARLVRGYRTVERQVSPAGDTDGPGEFFFRTLVDDDGSLIGSFRLPPAEGATLRAAIEAHESPAGDTDQDPAERSAEAVVAMAESALAAVDPEVSRWAVTVHVTEETLVGHDPDGAAWLQDGTPLEADTALRVACDCAIERLRQGRGKVVLDLGRRQRVVSRTQRRALMARDGGCRYPGCVADRHLRAHHIVHWVHGGRTDLANLILLCGHHHWLVHDGGYDVRGNADTGVWFIDAHGDRIDPTSRSPRSEPSRIRRHHDDCGLRITPATARSRWAGESCDIDQWVCGLLDQERAAAAAAA